jgi:ribokinase
MTTRIVVLGSSNTDMIVKMPRIPRPGETVIGGSFSTAGGGKGANQAVAAARAGGSVAFIARVGNDMFGDTALDNFREAGIDTGHVIRDDTNPSGVALICVDECGENSIAVASGCNANLSTEDVVHARDVITSASVLLMQLEVPLETVMTAAGIASSAGVRVIMNPAPAKELPDELLRHVAILTPNEHEAEFLTGIPVTDETSASKAATILRKRGIGQVLITMGSRGVWFASDVFTGMIPAFMVQTLDTTAAGDVFNGVLATGLAEGMALSDAITFANAAAAISVTRLGAQPSAPHRHEIEAFLADRT